MTDQLPGQLPLLPKRKPQIHGDLVDAAAALVLCQHDSPYVTAPGMRAGQNEDWETESDLGAAREAASRYLVACFDSAATAFEADEDGD